MTNLLAYVNFVLAIFLVVLIISIIHTRRHLVKIPIICNLVLWSIMMLSLFTILSYSAGVAHHHILKDLVMNSVFLIVLYYIQKRNKAQLWLLSKLKQLTSRLK